MVVSVGWVYIASDRIFESYAKTSELLEDLYKNCHDGRCVRSGFFHLIWFGRYFRDSYADIIYDDVPYKRSRFEYTNINAGRRTTALRVFVIHRVRDDFPLINESYRRHEMKYYVVSCGCRKDCELNKSIVAKNVKNPIWFARGAKDVILISTNLFSRRFRSFEHFCPCKTNSEIRLPLPACNYRGWLRRMLANPWRTVADVLRLFEWFGSVMRSCTARVRDCTAVDAMVSMVIYRVKNA